MNGAMYGNDYAPCATCRVLQRKGREHPPGFCVTAPMGDIGPDASTVRITRGALEILEASPEPPLTSRGDE